MLRPPRNVPFDGGLRNIQIHVAEDSGRTAVHPYNIINGIGDHDHQLIPF